MWALPHRAPVLDGQITCVKPKYHTWQGVIHSKPAYVCTSDSRLVKGFALGAFAGSDTEYKAANSTAGDWATPYAVKLDLLSRHRDARMLPGRVCIYHRRDTVWSDEMYATTAYSEQWCQYI